MMVKLEQQVEERSEVGQMSLQICAHPVEEMFQMADPSDHREYCLNQPSFVPSPLRAELEVFRNPLGGGKSQVGESDRLSLQPLHQGEKDLIMDISGIPTPGDDLPAAVDQPAEFDPDDPAVIRLPLLAELVGTAPLAPGMDQLDAICVHYSEECGIGEEELAPLLMGSQEPMEPRAMGQIEPCGIVSLEPAVKGTELNTLEGEEEADSDQLAGVEASLRMLGQMADTVVYQTEEPDDKIQGGHGFVPP